VAIYLDDAQVNGLLDMESCISAVEEAFREKAEGTAANQPRRRVPFNGRRYMMMFGGMNKRGYLAFKAYGVGKGQDVGLYKQGEGLVAFIRSGNLGQIRTGAASGVATKYMARPDASRLGCFGTGHQAETQITAIARVRKLESIYVYGRDAAKRKAFAEKMSRLVGIDVRPVETPEQCVKGRDILVTITNAAQPLFEGKWVEPGTHINAAGGNTRTNREIDEVTVTRCGTIATDDIEGAKIECGDLCWPVDRGLIAWEKVVELSHIVAGLMPGRRSADEITLFESQGIALEDAAAGALVYERALEKKLGTPLPF
jgi:alanine dehydrogenase